MAETTESYVLHQGSVLREGRRVVGPASFAFRSPSLTAVVGHGGAGKSSVLRALGGLASTEELEGTWTYRGGPLPYAERWRFTEHRSLEKIPSPEGGGVVLLEQLCRSTPLPGVDRGWRLLLEELRVSRASAWLLDEPTVGAPDDFVEGLKRLLLEAKSTRDIVLVTHDQSLVREVADDVCLLGGGTLELHNALSLFQNPPTPLAQTYLRTGSSWLCPLPEVPGLPNHFHWVLEDRLAGMGRPGLNRDVEEDLAALSGANVNVLISLTEASFPAEQLRPFGIEGRHFPIPDMGFPAVGPAARLCKFVETRLKDGDRVVFHCHAGLGRTGMMLAATLVWMRTDAREAIARIRSVNPRFIQTAEQERFLQRFQDDVG
ncbi:MAG: protein-tyrosine phosphatase family protein [Myxococcales bacterium]|nr:hypothetical protein [Polyangiaceae bacterium]MDW8250469.1 protein-tyrosine phosphatase family protein [Myxococcales bacterium]